MAGSSDRQEDAKVLHPSESHLEKVTSHQMLPVNQVGLANVQILLSYPECLCVCFGYMVQLWKCYFSY